jgi:hypothetical protein
MTVELTDCSGEMWSAKYRAYGNLAALDVSEIDNPLRFQKHHFDAETGLHYNRHRYQSGDWPVLDAGSDQACGWVEHLPVRDEPYGVGGSSRFI